MRGYTYLPILLFCLLSFSAFSQGTIRGTLFDDNNGEAIPYANIMLEGTSIGATTDLNGFFLINKIPAGTYTLLVRYIGYEDHREEVKISNGTTVMKTIKLRPTSFTASEVVITSNKVQERKVQTQVSVEKLTASQIQQMPSIGGQADLAQYMQVLPGVNSTGDQGGQLYIRGGSMIQNLCLLDGMIVYNPFHSIGLYSIFETDIILNADIYTGGFGAEYGGRLSSVMDISTRDGNKKRHSGKLGLNTFGASLILEGPLKRETESSPHSVTYLLSAKNSYLSKTSTILYPYIEGGLPFDFFDLYGKMSINSGTGSKINFFGFRFDDKVIGYHSISDYNWKNYGLGTKFVLVPGASSILEGGVAYSDYAITLSDGSHTSKYSRINGFNMSLDITNFMGSNKLKYGLSMEGFSTDYVFTNQYNIKQEQKEPTTNISIYGTYKISREKLLCEPSVRYIYYNSLNEGSLEPRIALKYNISDNMRVKFAGGLYSQIFLDARSDNDVVNLFNGFLTGSGALNKPSEFRGDPVTSCVQKAQHIVAGVEYDLSQHLIVNAELYFKNFSQLLNSNRNKMFNRSDPAYNPGGIYEKPEYYLTDFIIESGSAYGCDFSLCYDAGQLYVWATYSLGHVKRTDELHTYTPHYDRRHTINLLATYRPEGHNEWEFSGRWSYGSGFPFTQTQGGYENLVFDGIGEDYTTQNGTLGVHYAELYGGRLPNYHRLDASVKRKFSIGARSLLEVNLSATNVYNRNNIFYFDRITFQRIDQLPIMVSLGASFSF